MLEPSKPETQAKGPLLALQATVLLCAGFRKLLWALSDNDLSSTGGPLADKATDRNSRPATYVSRLIQGLLQCMNGDQLVVPMNGSRPRGGALRTPAAVAAGYLPSEAFSRFSSADTATISRGAAAGLLASRVP